VIHEVPSNTAEKSDRISEKDIMSGIKRGKEGRCIKRKKGNKDKQVATTQKESRTDEPIAQKDKTDCDSESMRTEMQ
jgi:predicted kinase